VRPRPVPDVRTGQTTRANHANRNDSQKV